MEGVFTYFTVALVLLGCVMIAAVLILFLGAWFNQQLTPEKFWQGLGFLMFLICLILLILWVYVLP